MQLFIKNKLLITLLMLYSILVCIPTIHGALETTPQAPNPHPDPARAVSHEPTREQLSVTPENPSLQQHYLNKKK